VSDTHGVRPPERQRAPARPKIEAGGFRVRSDRHPDHRTVLTVDYSSDAKPDEIRAAMGDVMKTALDELDRRFK
jgi:hypothetical protein